MLQRIEIENFRCLRSVAVPLRPLTVLIGPNDSGKSAFLDAVKSVVNGEGIQISDYWREDRQVRVSIVGETLTGRGRNATHGQNTEGMSSLQPVGLFHLPPQGVSMQSGGYPDDQGPQPIETDGKGVPGLLDYMLRRDRKRFFEVVGTL